MKKPQHHALTQKQENFCLNIIKGMTQADAYRDAYDAENMADKTIHEQASKLMANNKIAARIQELRAPVVEEALLTQKRIGQELARIALFDIRKLYREDGSMKLPHELDDDSAAALAGIDIVEMAGGLKIDTADGASHVPMYIKKAKTWDKNTAITNAMKHLGMLIDKSEVKHTGEITMVLSEKDADL